MAAVFAALRSPVLLVFSLAAAPPHLQHILQNLAYIEFQVHKDLLPLKMIMKVQ